MEGSLSQTHAYARSNQMSRLIIVAAALFCGSLMAQDTNVVVTTQFEDGSTNTWTQSDLSDALGLMNRKYHRDMESESGRTAWHGRRLQQYLVTNDVTGVINVVTLYADGYAHVDTGRKPKTYDPEANARAKAEAKAKADAIVAAWEAQNLPPALAAVRAAQRAAATTNEVTVIQSN